ncbi:hypothetical protein DFA_12232 [Cavenderia fasciculata]|uniref:ABC transporter domain-containing protein n=1 Tax=Cavenderia fasciculata TaxID=261658 RepID=F4QCT6_CACFS|nr:uncharacterized protein DFA_12232 [Cavenderia fasciculata]EGG14460.1 hypothetical protein DFA_12232 [Cavenderia fasciculata]|eukprot:XP_004353869.1 hypothetical protein DFA_12232 [Cavenderia fasciculata]
MSESLYETSSPPVVGSSSPPDNNNNDNNNNNGTTTRTTRSGTTTANLSYAQADEMVKSIDDMKTKRNFHNQFNALFRKSATYQWRQYKTNLCQIILPLILILLLFILQQIVTNFVKDQDGAKIPSILHPRAMMPPLFETNQTIVEECRAFAPAVYARSLIYIDQLNQNLTVEPMMLQLETYAGTNKSNGDTIVPLIFGQSFLGRYATYCSDTPSIAAPITMERMESYDKFTNETFDNWKTIIVNGGYRFAQVDNDSLAVSLLYNRSISFGKELGTLYTLASRSFRAITGASLTEIIFDGIKDFPTRQATLDFDLVSLLGPMLYIFIFQLMMPVVLRLILYEKENKLREIMKMMGLEMKTYWLVTYIFAYSIYFIAMMLVWALGALFRFRYFTVNSPLVIFLLIFFWGHTLVSFAFFLSTFFTKTETGTVVGYIWVFGTGILASRVIDNIFSSDSTPSSSIFVISIFPPFVLYRALFILKKYVSFDGPGVSIAKMNNPGYQFGDIYGFMIVEAVVFLILALYLEEVLPSDYGVKRHPLFFLQKSFWFKKGAKRVTPITIKPHLQSESEDVAIERQRVIHHDQLLALEVCDLGKVYPAQGGAPEKVAVKSLTLGVDQGICFGFLGPNGAGKSTTISCVSGLFPPTTGTARVFGMDIRDDIESIHMIMGVCPQDNVLWDDLTGEEHLLFYGRIKNMKGKELTDAVYNGLKQVNLHEETEKKSVEYSGGMRRRLSVAISMMGNPKIVLLDEPSTGLDPSSRKKLWDVVNGYKRNCAMLLTTHALEEAQELCDRLGIFVGGELKCIGSSSELISRFGKGYKVSLTIQGGREEDTQKFVRELLPSATLLNSLAGTYNYEVPSNSIDLASLFRQFEDNRERLGITDWGVANSTLEEVFVKVTMGVQNERGEYVIDEKSMNISHITNAY